MRALIGAMVLLAPALAGCSTVEQSPAAPSTDGAATMEWPLSNDLSGCSEVLLGVLRPLDDVQALLPPGFVAGDVSDTFGLPAPTDRALVAINGFSCKGSTLANGPVQFGDLLVTIEPPTVHNASVEPAPRGAYLFAQVTPSPVLADAFAALKVPVIDASIEVATTLEATGVTGSLRATDARGELYSAEVLAAPAPPETNASRLWHADVAGISHLDYAWEDAAFGFGTVVSCSIREGSLVHEVLGVTSCEGVETLGVVSYAEVSATSTYHRLPGASAEDGS